MEKKIFSAFKWSPSKQLTLLVIDVKNVKHQVHAICFHYFHYLFFFRSLFQCFQFRQVECVSLGRWGLDLTLDTHSFSYSCTMHFQSRYNSICYVMIACNFFFRSFTWCLIIGIVWVRKKDNQLTNNMRNYSGRLKKWWNCSMHFALPMDLNQSGFEWEQKINNRNSFVDRLLSVDTFKLNFVHL